MSFFFDVWTAEGFVLASDVKLIEEINDVVGKPTFIHKIVPSPSWKSGIKCALAVCGEEPEVSMRYFHEACTKDTFKDIAYAFAKKWTEHFENTAKYSAIHLVGYEKYHGFRSPIPQVWFFSNWSPEGFYSASKLKENLNTFAAPIPFYNHLPFKIKEVTGKFPVKVPQDEYSLVKSYLCMGQPIFSWNGDTSYWRSAGEVVSSGINLLASQKTSWKLKDAILLTEYCFKFLTDVATLLTNTTVGLSPSGDFDMLTVTSREVKWIHRAKLPTR